MATCSAAGTEGVSESQGDTPPPRLILYSKPDCHLCHGLKVRLSFSRPEVAYGGTVASIGCLGMLGGSGSWQVVHDVSSLPLAKILGSGRRQQVLDQTLHPSHELPIHIGSKSSHMKGWDDCRGMY